MEKGFLIIWVVSFLILLMYVIVCEWASRGDDITDDVKKARKIKFDSYRKQGERRVRHWWRKDV